MFKILSVALIASAVMPIHMESARRYHNFFHAVSVFHVCYLMLRSDEIKTLLTPSDVLSLSIGSLTHDVGHRGFNNTYEVLTGSDVALMYNDSSVLENYHAATTYR